MTISKTTILERWFEEVWNQGQEAMIDEMLAPAVRGHGLTTPDGDAVEDISAFKSFYRGFRSAFSDIRVDVQETVTEGDKTVARCLVRAVNTGAFRGRPPTGKRVEFTGICLVHIREGRIAESWNNFDFETMSQQLA
jgi:predicted ester cyclase